ncbi:hypothetical protein ACFFLS_10450 [Flavobacterium procerum]|uniref:Methyltransferase type 11 n=1 Tax=Flavobacterium procerum TaxID=1455569 RepID=A0ABV6BS46_9FLAO
MIVEIFKTNVEKETETNYIIAVIKRQFPSYKINFDLEDRDKILRVEALEPQWNAIVDYVNNLGFSCVRLE